MKITNLLVITFCLLLSSCSSSPEPKDVAQDFITRFESYEFEKAKEISTPELQKALDLAAIKMKVRQDAKKGEYKYKEEATQGDLSTVEFETKEQKKLVVQLSKREGKWLVANFHD